MRYEEVIRLLTRPIYAGYVDIPNWGLHMVKGHHEGLISFEQYAAIQARIKDGARAPARKDINADFPLRGFVCCADCDKPLTSCWSKSKSGKKHPYYMCFNKGCDAYRKSIRRDEVEGEFEQLLHAVEPAPKMRDLAFAMFKKIWGEYEARAKAAQMSAKRDLGKIDNQIEDLVDRIMQTTSATVQRAFEHKIETLEDQKRILSEKLSLAPKPLRPLDEMFEHAMAFLANPWKLWASDSLQDKRTALKLTFAERLAYCRNEGFRTPNIAMPFKVLGANHMEKCEMAETKGFEPSRPFRAYSLSRGAPSTTRPRLRRPV